MSQPQQKTSVIQRSMFLLNRLTGRQTSPLATEEKSDTLKTKPLPIMLLSTENMPDNEQLQMYKALDTSG